MERAESLSCLSMVNNRSTIKKNTSVNIIEHITSCPMFELLCQIMFLKKLNVYVMLLRAMVPFRGKKKISIYKLDQCLGTHHLCMNLDHKTI